MTALSADVITDPWTSLPVFLVFEGIAGNPVAIAPQHVTGLVGCDPSWTEQHVRVLCGLNEYAVKPPRDDAAATPVEAVARRLAGLMPLVEESRARPLPAEVCVLEHAHDGVTRCITDADAERIVAWADYRAQYGVTAEGVTEAHKAFCAGWDAARGTLDLDASPLR